MSSVYGGGGSKLCWTTGVHVPLYGVPCFFWPDSVVQCRLFYSCMLQSMALDMVGAHSCKSSVASK